MSTLARSHPATAALRRLQSQLGRQRWRGLGLALQLEVLALFALISAFVFWQMRLAMARVWIVQQSTGVVVAALALSLAALAAACALVVAVSVQRAARRSPLRTLWTSLPLDEPALATHLEWEARLRAIPLAALFPTLLLAAWGYLAPWILGTLGLAFVAVFLVATRAACVLGISLAPRERQRPIVAGPCTRALLVVRSGRDARPLPEAGWSRRPAWLAWWQKDLTVTLRSPSDLLTLLLAVALAVASSLVWSLGPSTWPRYLLGLAGAVAAVAVLAEWVVALAGHDPFVAVRSLPLGPAAVWTGRFAWVVLFTALLLVLHLGPLGSLRGPARSLYGLWLGGASLGIGTLAVNYGVTLFPNARIAQRLLGLALGLVLLAMLVLPPLSGLVALASGLIHSARRLPRWHRLEEA